MPDDWHKAGFGLYVHWPFCQSKCPYCDFNSHVSASIDQQAWNRAYLGEIRRIGAETTGRNLRSIYFGGGTPSLMDPALVDNIIAAAQREWRFDNDIEITLEANPSSVELARFHSYQLAGVNRVSLGVQALIADDLRALGRLHSVSEATKAIDTAAQVFDRYSFDLIYARQHQSLTAWQDELARAIALGADHMSLYQLTIEPGTAFGDRDAIGKLSGLPHEDLAADMYEITQSMMEAAGFSAYEVSNHAKPGKVSRHNLIYWNGGDYAGIGPGAHGRLTLGGQRFATETPLSPAVWLEKAANGKAENPREALSLLDQANEALMMGIRTSDGVETSRLSALGSNDFTNKINELKDMGLVEVTQDRLCATTAGRPILNEIIRQLLVV